MHLSLIPRPPYMKLFFWLMVGLCGYWQNADAQLTAGSITPGNMIIPSGSSPGTLTITPSTGCSGSYSYQWQTSQDSISWTAITGATGLSFSPGNVSIPTYYRVRTICSDTVYANPVYIDTGAVNTNLNYIRERNITTPGITDTTTANGLTCLYDVRQTTHYFDGLGRPLQTVIKQESRQQYDMVSFHVYDPFGRESTQYLPYTSPSNDGNFKADPWAEQSTFNAAQFPTDQFYYGYSNYEASPLNRVLNVYSPGNSWIGAGRGVSKVYDSNITGDSVQVWNISSQQGVLPFNTGQYVPGSLAKNVTIDEQGHQVIEYKDRDDRVVLRKVQLSLSPGPAHAGWLCTYYVYDSLENLRFVIPPRAVELINSSGTWNLSSSLANELCYRYEYDYRKRTVIRKVPGAGETWMVYDARDRLVMMQDSVLRGQHKWQFTRYDNLNRPDSTGLITDPTNYNNLAYHQHLAATSTGYPVLAGYTTEVLTCTFYDNYNWVAAQSAPVGATMATSVTSNSVFTSMPIASPFNAQAIVPCYMTTGLSTGSMTKVLGTTSQYLYEVHFFDQYDRVVQSQKTNWTGGADTTTTEYNFSGKSVVMYLGHQKAGNTPQYHNVSNSYYYDFRSRPYSTYQIIDNSYAPGQLINYFSFDELDRIAIKYFGITQQPHDDGDYLDKSIYTYNIRGWMTGINPSFLTSSPPSHYFGMELAYDDSASITGTTTYQNPVYNGNIAGVSWKSGGDQVIRKYDFTYDPVNRLTGGAYKDNKNGSWGTTAMDYSVGGLSYDANGNILSMRQNGYTLSSPGGLIDQLKYTYQSGSNKLAQVFDTANNVNSTLGDFHYNPTAKQSTDYSYDGNGNLSLDNNKGISSISYNYLDQPQQINFTGKGNIVYVYDAAGNKLKKIVTDTVLKHVTSTLYIGPYVYEQSDTATNPNGGTDTLQYMLHDEGRARWAFHKYLNGTTGYGWEYDFFEKDHLGNTRVVLTQQTDTAKYKATMEAAYRSTENALFYNIPTTCVARNTVMGYPSPDGSALGTTPNDSVCRVNGNGPKEGAAIILKVMAGDKVDVAVNYYYNNVVATSGQRLSPGDLINSLASGIVSVTGGVHGSFADLTGGSSPLTGALTSFLNSNNGTTTGKPNAYLNWVLLDNQFSYVSASSGGMQVGAAGTSGGVLQSPIGQSGINMKKSGYLYIYVSNATPGWDVYFDNLSVMTYSGPMLEETHYYPFGLTMANVSDKAIKGNYVENKYRFNKGAELQNKEFSDGSGSEMYETPLRSLDPQLGRWWQLDSKPNMGESPYASMGNNPLLHNDPLGDTLGISFRSGFLGLGKKNEVNYNNGSLTNKNGSSYNGKVKGFLKQTVNALNKINGTTDGSKVVSTLQSSANTFTIKDAAQNPNHPGNSEFVETDRNKSYAVALIATGQGHPVLGGSGGDIYWNSAGTELLVAGGTGVSPIADLAHEMFHGYESNFGMLNNDDPEGTGLARSEYRAAYFENQIREALSPAQPLRAGYRFRDAAGNPQTANLLDVSGRPIYVPPTFIPPALLPINLIY